MQGMAGTCMCATAYEQGSASSASAYASERDTSSMRIEATLCRMARTVFPDDHDVHASSC